MLTGVRDIDMIILNKLDDKDLVMVCKVNKYINKICNDQMFWLNRIITKYPLLSLEVMTKYKNDRSWSQYYIEDLRRINKDHLIKGSIDGRLDHVIIAIQKVVDDINNNINNNININVSITDKYLIDAPKNEALVNAAIFGYLDIVRYLTENGADIHTNSDLPLIYASYFGYLDIVKYLVKAGADIHARGDIPFIAASENGKIDIVKYYVTIGINGNNVTAINRAYQNKHNNVVEYLVSLGAPDPR